VIRIRFTFFALSLTAAAFAQTANRALPGAPAPANKDIADRLLDFVGPVPASEAPHKERFSEFALATVGPVPLLGEAVGAGIEQWENTPPEWGQGWDAFARRYWSNLAYNGIRQTITYGGSLALREDTRYFASNKSGFWPRAKHAVLSTFAARRMDGHEVFSFSNTAGVIGASALSSVWGPGSWKGPGQIAENAGVSFASTAAANVVREFLPDLLHRSRK
jgi:hypothetical protein